MTELERLTKISKAFSELDELGPYGEPKLVIIYSQHHYIKRKEYARFKKSIAELIIWKDIAIEHWTLDTHLESYIDHEISQGRRLRADLLMLFSNDLVQEEEERLKEKWNVHVIINSLHPEYLFKNL